MEIRFYLDEETGQPHIHKHGVEESEVFAVLRAPLEDGPGMEGARVAIGQTDAGRYLRVIYVPDPSGEDLRSYGLSAWSQGALGAAA